MEQKDIENLKSVLGANAILVAQEVSAKYHTDPRGVGPVRPPMVFRPKTTEEVSAILKTCNETGQVLVPQGGLTGLVGACRPQETEIPISLERMTEIEELDEMAGTMTVQAGCPLQKIQEAADAAGYIFPLDLGARGSCTIGGNLSTNAGGNRVIKYGMTRNLVLGLEAVLADGTVLTSLNKLIKNNAGYDLKHMFIGTEGTLGLITRVVLRLLPKPASQSVAFCALPDFPSVISFLKQAQSRLSGGVSAFEVLWQPAYTVAIENTEGLRPPVADMHPFYLLLEAMGGDQESDRTQLENVMMSAMEEGLLADAVIAKSEAEVANIWLVRDGIPEATHSIGPRVGFDISIELRHMQYFTEEMTRRLSARWPDHKLLIFGHLGDGNLHVVVNAGPDTVKLHHEIEDLVYDLTGELDGSISAEHGIGFSKRAYLQRSRSPEEIATMRRLKRAFDPNNILNPGRIFEMT